jgi:hypothetical protein
MATVGALGLGGGGFGWPQLTEGTSKPSANARAACFADFMVVTSSDAFEDEEANRFRRRNNSRV